MTKPLASPGAPAAPTLLRIGDVASQTGASADALRFYETRGLLRPVHRLPSGYREYDGDAVRLVRFIRRAQELGFTLAEVGELVRMRERAWKGSGPRTLRKVAVAKITEIDRRIRDLRAIRGALARLVTACDTACGIDGASDAACEYDDCCVAPTGGVLDCPLIEALEAETAPTVAPGDRGRRRQRSPAPTSRPQSRRPR